jgi:hypothetical protein
MTELYPCSICVLENFCCRFKLSENCLAWEGYKQCNEKKYQNLEKVKDFSEAKKLLHIMSFGRDYSGLSYEMAALVA